VALTIARPPFKRETEVNMLIEAFATRLTPGGRIEYAEIETVLGVPWRSSMFKTVLTAFCRKLRRDAGVEFDPEPGKALIVLNPNEIVRKGARYANYGRRKQRRGAQLASMPDDCALDNPARMLRDHIVRREAAYRIADREFKRGVIAELRPRELPPRVDPKDK
jgi:hypothetical protein